MTVYKLTDRLFLEESIFGDILDQSVKHSHINHDIKGYGQVAYRKN